ncbi:hypothetical protein [Phaffia rhodozyma]|uniref:Uncharacterized protein n=1 Tax=Phaffia rhodozyma TaxID=264483 RepID=A0A0F7SIP7_PHARH|nr:hypothetical protein [Phaffia rhodozyma]
MLSRTISLHLLDLFPESSNSISRLGTRVDGMRVTRSASVLGPFDTGFSGPILRQMATGQLRRRTILC